MQHPCKHSIDHAPAFCTTADRLAPLKWALKPSSPFRKPPVNVLVIYKEMLSRALKIWDTVGRPGLLPGPRWESSPRSPSWGAGGEGSNCPFQRTPPPFSALGASDCGLPGLAEPAVSRNEEIKIWSPYFVYNYRRWIWELHVFWCMAAHSWHQLQHNSIL